MSDAAKSAAGEAADELRRLLGAPEPGDGPADTPIRAPLPDPEGDATRGRALWRCDHCSWEGEAWVRPQCPRCYTMSTQPLRWV